MLPEEASAAEEAPAVTTLQAAAAADPDKPADPVVQALEPSLPECSGCGDRVGPWYPDPHGRRCTSGAQVMHCGTCVPDATPAEAVAAVVAAEMAKDEPVTARGIAAAEVRAGVTFDPQRIQAAVDAAREQARAECAAEVEALREEVVERGRQLAVMTDFKHRRDAVLRLCEGHRGDDLLLVSAVAVAAGSGTTALDGLPMTLTWTRRAQVPDAHTTRKRVVVECTSSYGGRADLVIDGDDRTALASLLDAEVPDVSAPCATDGCGTDQDWDASNPFLAGWSRLEIAALGDGPRWYCCDRCVFDALARAGHELAAEDRAITGEPHEQTSVPLTPEVSTGWEAGHEPEDMAADLDARYGPGASDECALQVAEATAAGFEDEYGDADEDGVR